MKVFERNIQYFLSRKNSSVTAFLAEHQVQSLTDLPIKFWLDFAADNGYSFSDLMQFPLGVDKANFKNIKLLILDVDGVMTDGGMYFTELGDQFKKYNTKDGMAIIHLTKKDFQVGIISSGFKQELVRSRADLLGIQHFYVGREPKLGVLAQWCQNLNISLDEVAIIGDDINDLPIINQVGFSACPSDAVAAVKSAVDLVLQRKGGEGCVREFIDYYLLEKPLGTQHV